MKNKWAYLAMNLCWAFSFLYAFTGATICNELTPDFETGIVFGITALLSRILGAVGFFFLIVIIKNNTKRKDERRIK